MSNTTFSDFNDLLLLGPDGDDSAAQASALRNARLAKPLNSLGQLEALPEFLARWQGKPQPTFSDPMVVLFAGNHGVLAQLPDRYAPRITPMMVRDYTNGAAAISQICAMHEINLRVFELALKIPTGDITLFPALDERTCAATIAYGMEAVAGEPDILAIGEMGEANKLVAAAVLAGLFGGIGRDWSGLVGDEHEEQNKLYADIVDSALARHAGRIETPFEVLALLGGREIAAMLGAIIAARYQKVPVFIDGLVATAAAAVAYAVNPAAIDHCLFAQSSLDVGQRNALDRMGKKPMLDLGISTGEGIGAALALVLAKTALRVQDNMPTRKTDTPDVSADNRQ